MHTLERKTMPAITFLLVLAVALIAAYLPQGSSSGIGGAVINPPDNNVYKCSKEHITVEGKENEWIGAGRGHIKRMAGLRINEEMTEAMRGIGKIESNDLVVSCTITTLKKDSTKVLPLTLIIRTYDHTPEDRISSAYKIKMADSQGRPKIFSYTNTGDIYFYEKGICEEDICISENNLIVPGNVDVDIKCRSGKAAVTGHVHQE